VRFLVLALIVPLFLASLRAQTIRSGWSPDYDTPGMGVGGRVFALGTWQNELIAGTYKSPSQDGVTLAHIGRFDGLRWRAFGAGVDGPVRAILDFQGSLMIGGDFRWSGSTQVTGVARWTGSAWAPIGAGLGGGLSSTVWDLCEHQGELYAVGDFTQSGAQTIGQVARFDGTSWQTVGTPTYTGLGFPEVHTIVSDGQDLYVGGEFTAMNGVPASHLARWDGTAWHGVGGGVNSFGFGNVWDLALLGSRLVVGGAIDTVGSVLADDVAVWDGQVWSRLGPDLSNQVYGSDVRSLCVYGGELYVGGSFNVLGSGTAVHRIVRYDGTTLQPCGGAVQAEVNPGTIFAMVAWGGELFCGGEFQGIVQPGAPSTPSTACYHIASFDGTRWARLGTGDHGMEAEAKVMGRWQGKRVIGGRMTYAGTANANGLAVFENGSWHAIGTFAGLVWDLLEHQGDLWVVGQFTQVDGITVNGVARYDGQQWHALGNGPNLLGCYTIAVYQGQVHVGTVGNPVRWTGSTWQPFTSNIFGTISTMHVHNGVLYFGGSTPFTTGSPNLFQWDGSTVAVVGGGTNGAVRALGSYGADLVVGGEFTQAGGQPMDHVTRWNGSSFAPLGVGLPGSTVVDFAMLQGELVAAGDIHAPQGGDYVARFDGSQWRGMTGGSPDSFVNSLLVDDARGELHVAGWFHRAGGIPSPNHAVWHLRLPWWDLGSGLASSRRPPRLEALSTMVAGESLRLDVSSVEEFTIAVLGLGTGRLDVPAFGCTLVPNLDIGTFAALADGLGRVPFGSDWPVLPAGYLVYGQAFCFDPSMPEAFSATNAIVLQQP